jgi:hypothetical protein
MFSHACGVGDQGCAIADRLPRYRFPIRETPSVLRRIGCRPGNAIPRCSTNADGWSRGQASSVSPAKRRASVGSLASSKRNLQRERLDAAPNEQREPQRLRAKRCLEGSESRLFDLLAAVKLPGHDVIRVLRCGRVSGQALDGCAYGLGGRGFGASSGGGSGAGTRLPPGATSRSAWRALI